LLAGYEACATNVRNTGCSELKERNLIGVAVRQGQALEYQFYVLPPAREFFGEACMTLFPLIGVKRALNMN